MLGYNGRMVSSIALALAVLTGGPFAFDADPQAVLAEISKLRSEASTKARESGAPIDISALNAQVKAKAEAALADANLAEAEAADCYAWAQLSVHAGKPEQVPGLVDRYLTSSAPDAQKFSAAGYAVVYAEGVENKLSYVNQLKPTTDSQKLTKLNYVLNYIGQDLAQVYSSDEAIGFIDGLIADLPESPPENLAATTASMRSRAGEMKVDILLAAGEKTKAMALLDDLIAKADGNAVRSLNAKKTRSTLVGQTAPDFTASHTINGEFKGLEALKGKVVIVDFFAHWCGPCINSFPDMRQMYADLHSQGLEVVHVTRFYGYYGSERDITPEVEHGKCREFVAKHELPWTVVHVDPKVFDSYGVTAIPTVALVNAEGKVEQFKIGYTADSFKEFRAHIEHLLAEAKKN